MKLKSLLILPYEATMVAAASKILFGPDYYVLFGIIASLLLIYRIGQHEDDDDTQGLPKMKNPPPPPNKPN